MFDLTTVYPEGTIVVGTDIFRRNGDSMAGQIFRVETLRRDGRVFVITHGGREYAAFPNEIAPVKNPIVSLLFEALVALREKRASEAAGAVEKALQQVGIDELRAVKLAK